MHAPPTGQSAGSQALQQAKSHRVCQTGNPPQQVTDAPSVQPPPGSACRSPPPPRRIIAHTVSSSQRPSRRPSQSGNFWVPPPPQQSSEGPQGLLAACVTRMGSRTGSAGDLERPRMSAGLDAPVAWDSSQEVHGPPTSSVSIQDSRSKALLRDGSSSQMQEQEMMALSKQRRRSSSASSGSFGEAFLRDGSSSQIQMALRKQRRRSSSALTRSFMVKCSKVGFTSTESMLDEALGMRKNQGLKRGLMTDTFYRVEQERVRRARDDFEHPYPKLAEVVQSPRFEFFVGALMCIDGMLIGIRTSLPRPQENLAFWGVMEHALMAVVLLEVTFRWIVGGWIWIFGPGNALDFVLIFLTGVLPMLSDVRILRVLRLVRVTRIFPDVPFFQTPYKLIRGLLASFRFIAHIWLVLGAPLLFFAVCALRTKRLEALSGDPTAAQAVVQEPDLFSTLPMSSFTLFQVMTLDSWTSVARPLMEHKTGIVLFIILTIVVNTVILSNLIAACILERFSDAMHADAEMTVAAKQRRQDAEVRDLHELFLALDADGNGALSFDEFMAAVKDNERFRCKLQLLQVPMHEAQEVWEMMLEEQREGDDEVAADRFASFLYDAQGAAKAKDVINVGKRVRHLNRRLVHVKEKFMKQKQHAEELCESVREVRGQLFQVLHEVKLFVQLAGPCVPTEPAPLTLAQLHAFSAGEAPRSQPVMVSSGSLKFWR